jgi:hypothetical protein
MSYIVMISGGTKFADEYLAGFTLPFPPLTEAEIDEAVLRDRMDMVHEAVANNLTKHAAAVRKARRNALRLWYHAASTHNGKLVRGPGFVPFTPGNRAHAPLAIEPSTRAELRRAKFGRK